MKCKQTSEYHTGGLRGYYSCSYKDLETAFGTPPVGVDGKVSTEWKFKDEEGKVWSVYDYKETNLYDPSLQSVAEFREWVDYSWHIGGGGSVDRVKPFVQWLHDEVKMAIADAHEAEA